MTFTYQMDPGTGTAAERRDAMRLLLKDTDDASFLYHDEELAFFLGQNNNALYRSAADAAAGLAAREADSKSVGDLAISGFGKSWRDLAVEYRMKADSRVVPYAGGISVSDKQAAEDDTDRVVPMFSRTLFENPAASGIRPPGTEALSS